MSKSPEVTKYASDLAKAQNSIRSANEELIKLSQRFGRMVPKIQRLDSSAILSWFTAYNKIKDCSAKADENLASLLNNEQITSNPALSYQLDYYNAQRSRFYSKIEVIDDILNGMIEDLLEGTTFAEPQKEEMMRAWEETVERSSKKMDLAIA